MAKKGDRILNRFTITEEILAGTETPTYIANDAEGGVVKILEIPVEALDSWDTLSRFEKRAEQYAELSSESLPGFVGYYTDESADPPAIYFVQERVEGSSLEEIVGQTGPLGAEAVTRMLVDLLNGLSALHRLSPPIVHGGIRPDTIRRSVAGAYRFTDLPLPGRSDESAAPGAYVPPEQREGSAGKPSDIYSLGMSALFAATGTHPPAAVPGRRNPLLESAYLKNRLGRILEVMIEPDIAYRSSSAGELLSRLSGDGGIPAGKTQSGPAGSRTRAVEIVSTVSQDSITVNNPDASRPENLLIGALLDLWTSRPWLIIIIAAVLSAGPVAVALLIFLLHPKSKILLNRAYAKIRDVYMTLGRQGLSVSDQLESVEYADVSGYDIRELNHPSGIQLETVLHMRNGKEIRFYLNSLDQEQARQIRKLIDVRFHGA